MAKELTNIEKSILAQLELNSRISFSHLGKKIRISQQRVSYTVNSLIEKGIISKFYSLIDYSKLNVLSFRVFFKVSYITENRFEELINYLVSDPYISWVATCGGRYDLICAFMTLNPSQFNKNLRSIMQKFPEQLKNYNVLTTIVIRNFGRKYLLNKISDMHKQIFIGGDRKPEDIDEIDMKILDEIAENARISSVDIANKLSLTPKTIMERIKKLHKREIILGYKPLLNLRKAGYTKNLLLIKYHNISLEMEDKLIDYLKLHPNVINIVKTLGEWDIEVEIEVKEPEELRKIEIEIRQKFALLIQEIESIPLYKSYKKNFFPKFLIEKGNSQSL